MAVGSSLQRLLGMSLTLQGSVEYITKLLMNEILDFAFLFRCVDYAMMVRHL